jgi:hypothetical protein
VASSISSQYLPLSFLWALPTAPVLPSAFVLTFISWRFQVIEIGGIRQNF